MSQSERAPVAGVVMIVGGALLALASFLPWAEVSGQGASVTAKGIDGSDGYLTLAAGIVAVILGVVILLRGTRRILAILAILVGIVGGGLALYDAVTAKDSVLDAAAEELAPSFGVSADQVRAALDQAVDAGQIGVSVSFGLYLAVAGGVVLLVGGVVGLRGATLGPAPNATGTEASAPPSDPSTTEPRPVPSSTDPTSDLASETIVAPPPPPPGPDDA